MNDPITLGDWTADLCRLPVKDKRVLAANLLRSLPDVDREEVIAKVTPITREEILGFLTPPAPAPSRVVPSFWHRQVRRLNCTEVAISVTTVLAVIAAGILLGVGIAYLTGGQH